MEVKVPEKWSVKIEQETTFENFVGQFQAFCPKLLCVVDGTCLRYYDKYTDIPKDIRYDYKQRRENLVEYYFRDIHNDSLYCVFGREAAKIFYPRIDEVDVDKTNGVKIEEEKNGVKIEAKKRVTIVDKGIRYVFSNNDYSIEVLTHYKND